MIFEQEDHNPEEDRQHKAGDNQMNDGQDPDGEADGDAENLKDFAQSIRDSVNHH